MLTDKDMLEIAEKYIDFLSREDDIELMLFPEYREKMPYGNIYSYDGKKYFETQDIKDHLIGTAPFLVEKESGKVVQFGTAYPLEKYLDFYENNALAPSLDLYWYPDTEEFSHK